TYFVFGSAAASGSARTYFVFGSMAAVAVQGPIFHSCSARSYFETVTNKALTVIKAAGLVRLKNNTSPLNVLLVGFYSRDDDPQNSTLP
ncbi:506_t:CDS:2, partial [Ambispora leptoticha]